MTGGGAATVIDPGVIRHLAAMDIQVWRIRRPSRAAGTRAASSDVGAAGSCGSGAGSDAGSATRAAASGRIRLEAGSGRWLLVVDDAERARHASLLEDIRAALGPRNCRFGTWSDSSEAGVAVDEWAAHGIRHALVFGTAPASGFISGAPLAQLASSGDARRALWRKLQSALER